MWKSVIRRGRDRKGEAQLAPSPGPQEELGEKTDSTSVAVSSLFLRYVILRELFKLLVPQFS